MLCINTLPDTLLFHNANTAMYFMCSRGTGIIETDLLCLGMIAHMVWRAFSLKN